MSTWTRARRTRRRHCSARCCLGTILDTGTAILNEPVEVQSLTADPNPLRARLDPGADGASLSRRRQFRRPLAIAVRGRRRRRAATGTVTFGGTATAPGTINLYIGGINVRVGVDTGDTAGSVASAALDAMATYPDLAVTGTANRPGSRAHRQKQGAHRQRHRSAAELLRPGWRRVHAGRDHRRHHADGGRHRQPGHYRWAGKPLRPNL